MTSIGDELEAITAELWEAMFTDDLSLTVGGERQGGPHRSCLVWIEGDPQRGVCAQFPEALAVELTKSLLRSPDTPDNEAIADAVGELGNILAGNIKTCFPGHATLSLPAVTSGADYELKTLGTKELATRTFTTGGGVFVVSLLEADPGAGG